MKRLIALLTVLASLACHSEPLVFVTGGGSGGGSGAVDSVNGKTGTVVLNGTDIKVTETSTTNIAVHLANKVNSQWTSSDDGKVLTIDPTDHKVKPMTSSSGITFKDVIPADGGTYSFGNRGLIFATCGGKSMSFTYDREGYSVPLDNTNGEIVLTFDTATKKIQVAGTSTATYYLTIITPPKE